MACVSLCRISFNLSLCLFGGGAALVGCTTPDPLYCDEDQDCGAGQVCNLEKNTCAAAPADASVDGQGDGGPRPDGSGDGAADGQADTLKGNGASCAAGSECQSGFCADQVCCDASCTDTCRSCAMAGQEGTCSLAPEGQDPRQDCTGEDLSCGGSCDGEGSCSFAAAQTECAAPSCSAGTLTLSGCDGQGSCTSSPQDCGGYACAADGKSCRTSCSSSTDCTGTFQCLDGHCVNQLPLGEACGTNNLACASGNCVDGVCCQQSGCGSCQRCNLAGQLGHCSAVPDDTACGAITCISGSLIELRCNGGSCQTVSTSCSPYVCNSAGSACRSSCGQDSECAQGFYCGGTLCLAQKQNGEACGSDHECATGICTDEEGVCCDSECGGECESCAGLSKCTFKAEGTPCGPGAPYCVDQPYASSIREQTCDGLGACAEQTLDSCDPYRCSGTPPTCTGSCDSPDDCTAGLCDLLVTQNTCRPASEVCHSKSTASCSAGTGSAATPFCTIQTCLDQGKSYVAVADGTYSESLVVSNSVRVISTGTSGTIRSSSSNEPRVIVQPTAASTIGISISGGHTVLLYGLELRHPSAPTAASGTLIRAINNANVTLRSSVVHNAINGHCVQVGNATLALVDAELKDCPYDGIHAEASYLSLTGVSILTSGGNGLWQDGLSLTVDDALIASSGEHGVMLYSTTVGIGRCYSRSNVGTGFRFENSTSGIVGNSLAAENGNGIVLVNTSSPPLFYNVTSAGNDIVAFSCGSTTTPIYNTICRGPYSGSCSFNYSNVSGSGAPGTMNITADPKFLTLGGNTYYFSLDATSACVDSGLDSVPGVPQMPQLDYLGRPRFVDRNPGGRIIDIGAGEVQ